MQRRSMVGLWAVLFGSLLWSAPAGADVVKIQRPRIRGAKIQARIRANRRRQIPPARPNSDPAGRKNSIERRLNKQAKSLAAMDPSSAAFRKAISVEPLQVRLKVLERLAKADNQKVATFERRIHAMLANGKKAPVKKEGDDRPTLAQLVHEGGMATSVEEAERIVRDGRIRVNGRKRRTPGSRIDAAAKVEHLSGARLLRKWRTVPKVSNHEKRFFEVTQETFGLFKQVMGPNVVWFNVSSSPGHLHTLIADQGSRGKLWHDTYGTVSGDEASMPRSQYSFGVALTDSEMHRFIRYQEAGAKANRDHGYNGKRRVYGFFRGGRSQQGGAELAPEIACTNWATSAPIGELPRWVRSLDRRVKALADQGALGRAKGIAAVKKDGVHAALAALAPEKRPALITKLLEKQSGRGEARKHVLRGWNRSALKRLGKLMARDAEAFPDRPADLLLRDSLSKVVDNHGRSQDPAKWSWDLLLSRAVPVVAVFNPRHQENFASMKFNMEIMGTIDEHGEVVPAQRPSWNPNARLNLGEIPASRRP